MTDSEESAQQQEAPGCRNWDINDPNQQEVTRILKSFKIDLMGIIHLGSDGVMRSLTADRSILSAEGFSPILIETFLSRMPERFGKGVEEADGTQTPREKWFKPDEGILPPPLAEERMEESRNMSEERRELLRQRMKSDPQMVDVSGILGPIEKEGG